MYAIVDIETTGGNAENHRITEIAIFIHDGEQVINHFETLINPEIPIPAFIENYTGITNKMVKQAPTFEEVSEQIYELLQPHIFVAHHVNFDYSFIKHQLALCGLSLQQKKLCTVRLSRKLFQGLHSYSLGNLTAALQIPLQNRHRAGGDGKATVLLFEKILTHQLGISTITSALKKGSKEAILPANLAHEEFAQLPEKSGIYYFHDEGGKVIYVGKAKNIKQRVYSHFAGKTTTAKKQQFHQQIRHITHQITPDELQALILESIEIRKHWPKYNIAQKRKEFPVGLFMYEDHNGYQRLAIDYIRKYLTPLKTFKNINEATSTLKSLVTEYELCPKLANLQSTKDKCVALEVHACKGACEKLETCIEYNMRVDAALEELREGKSFALVASDKKHHQINCVIVEKGLFYGMGSVEEDLFIPDFEELKSLVTGYKTNYFIDDLLQRSHWHRYQVIEA